LSSITARIVECTTDTKGKKYLYRELSKSKTIKVTNTTKTTMHVPFHLVPIARKIDPCNECSRRPNMKLHKCDQLGHVGKIYKS